ncbi:serine/threonine-protein kinase STY13-like [Cynara cardunculus var. scolymus]|uniref:serine/threonine-protein kinase STY13-like n=1 Tax=Cynara cardunculus var. scolymus TaxID=59895 RepID=UPI000D630F65|nr:serine/threonine-protein kinase STY13-like [Cynara cardunculus var. scolymus]
MNRQLFRSWRKDDHHPFINPLQSDHREEEEQKWQETIDPSMLVLGKIIGRGSFGVVHKGSYQGQTVAVKVLDFGDARITEAKMEFVKMDFIKEVNLWKNLHHPNITKMIGATMSMTIKKPKLKTESNFCIVSEYVKGGSLRSYLSKNRNKKLPLKTVVRFALDIAKGLCYLHSKKIIHCDVKPENMLIDEQHTIKLADFGESRFESLEHFLIQSGEIGTRSYMAPEVVSRKPYGCKCDVFSFGICLWEIYCCEFAYTFDLDNIPADIYKYLRPSIPVTCPRSLAQLMERCWDTDPRKRPAMKDVVVELEEIGKSETMSEDHEARCRFFGFFELGR